MMAPWFDLKLALSVEPSRCSSQFGFQVVNVADVASIYFCSGRHLTDGTASADPAEVGHP